MIWADRFALGFALLLVVLAFVISLLAITGASETSPFSLEDVWSMVLWTAKAQVYAALPFWALLRISDFMFGGPASRRRKSLG